MNIKALAAGCSGSGKTYFAHSFPKIYSISTEPGGSDTWKSDKMLVKNVVKEVLSMPESPQDTKRIFEELNTHVIEAKKMFKEGKVETLVIDNASFLSENRWIYEDTHNRQFSKNGELNKLAMFGNLARWMYQFFLMQLLTFQGNVVVTVHEMLESDEILDKKPDRSTPIMPSILGGFRDKIEGMFSLVLYLHKRTDKDNKYVYKGQTDKMLQRNGKNRYGLPPIIDNISYSEIMKSISK